MKHTLVQPPEILKLAGHAVRWNLLTTLARSDYRVQDLNGTLNGLSERVMERIPVLEREGVQKALSLLLVALQAEVDLPSLPADIYDCLAEGDGRGTARCTCD